MRFWLGVFVAGFVVAGSAWAASFNCAKAVTPQEKAICSDKKLSAADEEMAAAYKQTMTKVSERAQGEMRGDQREWVKWMAAVCESHKAGGDAALAKCMLDPYQERIAMLRGAVEQKGSVQFYTRSAYLEAPNGKDDHQVEGTGFPGVGTLTVQWPQADETGQTWMAWNRGAARAVIAFAGNAKSTTLTPDMAAGGDTEVKADVAGVSEARVTLHLASDTMGHGAAHPNEAWKNVHWLLKDDREMRAGDVFRSDTAWKAALAQRCWVGLKKQFPDEGLFIKSANDKILLDVVGSAENWTLTKEGLSISFPEYSVAPRVDHPEDVLVPWTALKAYVRPDFDPKA